MLTIQEQIELLLSENIYQKVVALGLIQQGESLIYQNIFSLTCSDLKRYFQQYGLPGVDDNHYRYRGEGPLYDEQNGIYSIYWLERGCRSELATELDEVAFRQKWGDLLCKLLMRW